MIKFSNSEIRKSGVIFSGMYEQIKDIYTNGNPELASELAISYFEYILTGVISSDIPLVRQLITPTMPVVKNEQIKYDKKESSKRNQKRDRMKLDEIAGWLNAGWTQSKISKHLGVSPSTISDRVKLIKADFPELLICSKTSPDENSENSFGNPQSEFWNVEYSEK